MLTDKQQKKEFKKVASADPDSYYPTRKLKAEGFARKQCTNCGMFFWTVVKGRTVCGDPACSGGFDVVSNNPAKVSLTYEGVWNKIVEMLEPRGYKKVDRYPVVARWNPTMTYTIASIAAFQPFVITGEVEPPAKKLVIPQFCLRFGDIDNVGITGSHCTGFVMIGQHAFLSREEWNQEQFFTDIYEFLTVGIGLEKKEITIHEDAWAGGGSFGPCMEFFSRGVELFNQVYTMFEQTPEGDKELRLKVLDMGLGMERIAWFSQAKPNLYEATFPAVLEKIRERTKVEPDFELYRKFSRYSAYLNVDEVDNIEDAWRRVAREMKVDIALLRGRIMPMAAIYSIAEHARALLLAINDGGLPSNTGGGYNLRVILRRALSFIDQHGWDLDLGEIAAWHAEELKTLFPELLRGVDNVKKILAFEKRKFEETKGNVRRILERIVKENQEVTLDRLLELYDSQGIAPELVKREAEAVGRKVDVPDDFYKRVGELHERKEQIHATKRQADIDLAGVPDTEPMYFDDYAKLDAGARVIKVSGKYVVLDKTTAYPTSGGQLHDVGTIGGRRFVDAFKDGGVIVHVMEAQAPFKEGDAVAIKVDKSWRDQLSQHHTATHVVNAAARAVLGSHVNQAGAKKTIEKAHLDITHYDSLSKDEEKAIEQEANRIVEQGIPISAGFLPRSQAEQKYGMSIYQGGAVPGKNLRIVAIGDGLDVEACGGTHLHNTSEIGKIKIIKSSKIQDGIVRIEFTAGPAASVTAKQEGDLLGETARIFGVKSSQVPARGNEVFSKWKKLKKIVGTDKEIPEEILVLSDTAESKGDALAEIAEVFKTQPEHVPKNAEKFLRQYYELVDRARKQLAAKPPAKPAKARQEPRKKP
ncbi:MAG: alanine--tRNA ligase [Candidatus Lokiarchaeota archaeon]|nr:alanine--tRNA ligase [Candidatus Lokiarchaeota archaeon]